MAKPPGHEREICGNARRAMRVEWLGNLAKILQISYNVTRICVPEFAGCRDTCRMGSENMYSFESRIRYSETGSDGRLTLLSLLNYFQDCAIFHSEDLDVGVEYLEKIRGVWVMNFWQTEPERRNKAG